MVIILQLLARNEKSSCKHAVAALVNENSASAPRSIDDCQLVGLRKRGRPKKDVGRPSKAAKQQRFT